MVKQIFTLLPILFSVISIAQVSPPSDSQTLLQSQDQIRKQMEKATDFRHPYSGDIRAFIVPLFKFDGCSLRYHMIQRIERTETYIFPLPRARRNPMVSHTMDRLKIEYSKKGTLLLGDLDPNRIKVRVQDAHVVLTLQTEGGKRSIKQVLTISSPSTAETSEGSINTLYIHFKEESSAKLVAEAFSKAIESCLGKKDHNPGCVIAPASSTGQPYLKTVINWHHCPRQQGTRFSKNAPMPSCASSAIAFKLITSFV
ncbi:MAG: hypothetical protein JNM09_29030 [Blastocatellia bacterium]|nr:hypothetical protein [Blastocatellia bacterium]